jgi:hypothetical protein
MLGIRTLLGLEPKGEVLTAAADAVSPPWMGTLTVEGIRGRWGRASAITKGNDQGTLSIKQIYERVLAVREDLGEAELVA